MERLKPLNDFIFQKLMGEKGSEDELCSFLSAVLGRELKSVTILENKRLTAEIIGDKTSILDVRATTDENTHVNIEVQIKTYKHMDTRSLFYFSKIFAAALEAGKDYKELPNVITINILDFEFIGLERYHTRFHMWEDAERYLLTEKIETHFIEMPKFLRLAEKDIANNPLHRWLTFFDQQITETVLKELIEMDTSIKKANERLKFLSTDKEFLHQVHLREIALSDYNTAINDAKDEGRAEGIVEGKEEALKEAKARDIERAKKMIKRGIPIDDVLGDFNLVAEDLEDETKDMAK